MLIKQMTHETRRNCVNDPPTRSPAPVPRTHIRVPFVVAHTLRSTPATPAPAQSPEGLAPAWPSRGSALTASSYPLSLLWSIDDAQVIAAAALYGRLHKEVPEGGCKFQRFDHHALATGGCQFRPRVNSGTGADLTLQVQEQVIGQE